ncbi:MAG: hypothetical protein IPP28_09655 [Xanthomonadales bacterium]|nr:hypothetical protein [Xanthomonadales bacterium]
MILRRLAQSLKEQNWTAITIEFVLLVLGVFLGIQAANWNEARGDRSREAVYLASLMQDLRSDIDEIDEVKRVSTLRLSAMGYLLTQATGAPLPSGFDSARGRIEIEPTPAFAADDPNSIGIAMFILTTLDGNRLAYDTMINTGGIGVIRDDALLRAIQSYYSSVDKVRTFEAALEINRVKLVDAQQQAGLSPVDAMTSPQMIAAFADHPALLAAAKNYWLYTNRHLKLMNDLRAAAEHVVDDIGQRTKP